MKTLVTGGIRSGKSAYAESLLQHALVSYLATSGTRSDDPAWVARVAGHRRRRPASWTTVESHDVPAALTQAQDEQRAVLLDDLGGWLTAQLDDLEAWETHAATWRAVYAERRAELLAAVEKFGGDLVVVTGEVGYGLVPLTAAGRLFTDELGLLNQELAARVDRVVLVACGCPLPLKSGMAT